MKTAIYMAHRYSGTPEEQHQRNESAAFYHAKFIEAGLIVINPVSHSHRTAQYLDPAVNNHETWMEQDWVLYQAAKVLVVITDFDFRKSSGVADEMKWASDDDKPTYYVNRDNFLNAVADIKRMEAQHA